MKKSLIFFIVFLIVIFSFAFFILGSLVTKNKIKLIYIPVKKSSLDSAIKGSFKANISGKIVNINKTSFILQGSQEKATFAITENIKVIDLTAINSTAAAKIAKSNPLPFEKEISLKDIQINDFVSAKLFISDKGLYVDSLYLMKKR